MKKTKPFIEPLILPLVNAINQTGLFTTFSSCEGHFAPGEQTIDDRNRADVRFERRKGISEKRANDFLYFLVNQYPLGLIRAGLSVCKIYAPFHPLNTADFVYVIQIEPYDRFDTPEHKRAETDEGIDMLLSITYKYQKMRKKKGIRKIKIQTT
ncbi:MAG: hypothetical protein IM449_16955 [Microcystis sp. M065S1]|jgi:hypothetical protein|nr:hypothetical protein [Microcystis sp. M065S1]